LQRAFVRSAKTFTRSVWLRRQIRVQRSLNSQAARSILGGTGCCLNNLLFQCDLVAQAESDSLSLAADPQVASQRAVSLFLYANINKGILPKNRLGVQVGSKEPAVTCCEPI